MKNKRGQAALEFLMTYGWVILVVLVAIGALVYFGFLNPEKMVSERCVLSVGSGLQCEECSAREGSVTLRIRNGAGGTVLINEINLKGKGQELECMPWGGIRYIAADAKEDFTIFCPLVKEGGKLNAVISVQFSEDGGLVKATAGEVLTSVGAEADGGGPGPGPSMACVIEKVQIQNINPSGGMHTVIARVTEDGNPVGEGLPIDFTVEGANNLNAMRETRVDGTAWFKYEDLWPITKKIAQMPTTYEDTIYACHFNTTTGENDFCCSAKKTWTITHQDYINCILEPVEDENVVWGIHKVKATVTKNGVPLTNAKIKFYVDGVSQANDVDRCPDWPFGKVYPSECIGPDWRDGFSTYPFQKVGQAGVYYFAYQNRGFAGTDVIYAIGYHPSLSVHSLTSANTFVCNKIEKQWVAPEVQCEITPRNWTKKIIEGTYNYHSVIITVKTKSGQPIPGVFVDVELNGAPSCVSTLEVNKGPTNSSGQISYTFMNAGELNPKEGTDTVAAYGTYSNQNFKCAATVKWINPYIDCVLLPTGDKNPVDDGEHTVTAFVHVPKASDEVQTPEGIAGVKVNFNVEALYATEDELLASGSAQTNSSGYASFTYKHKLDLVQSQVPAYDLIIAGGVDQYGRGFDCRAVKIWTYPMAKCVLKPAKATNALIVKTSHTVEAYVERCKDYTAITDAQNCGPWKDVTVRFDIKRVDGTVTTQYKTTNSAGIAVLEYQNVGGGGIDYIYATGVAKKNAVTAQGSVEYRYPFRCSAIKEWV